MDGHMPISCHFRDCKALLVTSLTDVSGAIPSAQTFTFTFNFTFSSADWSVILVCGGWSYVAVVSRSRADGRRRHHRLFLVLPGSKELAHHGIL